VTGVQTCALPISWIATEYPEALSALAASIVLGVLGEDSIRDSIASIAAIHISDMVSNNLEEGAR
jgi:hypothetical protein